MKNLRFLTICGATMLLVACTQDDVTTTASYEAYKAAQPTPIAFSTYLGEQAVTRNLVTAITGEATQTTLETNGFGVFAYHTTSAYTSGQSSTVPNFMYNEKVSSSSWTYSPIKYWPNDFANGNVDNRNAQGSATNSYLSFFAYAPWTGDENNGNGGISSVTTGITAISAKDAQSDPTISYVMDTANPVDVLWGTAGVTSYTDAAGQSTNVPTLTNGKAPVNANLSKQTTGGQVNFSFKHALARLGNITIDAFADVVRDGSTNSQAIANTTKITVTSVTVSTTAMPLAGTLNLATGVWDHTSVNNGAYTYTFGGNTQGAIALNTVIAEPAQPQGGYQWTTFPNGVPAAIASYIPANLTASSFPFITFFPDQRPTFTVTIVYTVRTEDGALDKGWSEVEQTISKSFQFGTTDDNGKFEMNKIYNLAIHLGLTSVKFTATVDSWDSPAVGQEVDLPINVSSN